MAAEQLLYVDRRTYFWTADWFISVSFEFKLG